MKAIIMAGGEGRRLRPVSGDAPKPLVPLLGRPMMEHIILLLRRCGFDEICVTLRYKADMISERFGDGSALGVKLCYRVESEPAGTAGGVKNCEDFYGNEDFLVISGDAACDFDLSELMRVHKERRAAATIALQKRSEPLRYGLAVTDSENRIHAFIEKPDWPRVVTDTVNTGIYVLSPTAMRLAMPGVPCDFGRDLFPEMLRRDMTLIGLPMAGYWCDVGTPISYYQCCVDALSGRLRIDIPEVFCSPAQECDDSSAAGFTEEYRCRDRAALMGALSRAVLDMGASYDDGIALNTPRARLRVFPAASSSALRIAVASQDSEFAEEFAAATKNLLRALEEK